MLLDPTLEWPLHLQLSTQLQAAIEDGLYEPGERLPSVRELAAILRVNRNTIVHAYELLEHAGYVRGEAGRGYFAALPPRRTLTAVQEALLKETLTHLASMDDDPVPFAKALLARALRVAGDRRQSVRDPRVAVVECTTAQATLLAHDLTAALQVPTEPLLLSSLLPGDPSTLAGYDLFVTTYQHADEVREAVGTRAGDVIPCLLTAHFETLKALERVPDGARVGVACTSWDGTKRLHEMVEQAGYGSLTVIEGASDSPETLPGLLDGTALIIAATPVAQILKAFAPGAPVVADDRTFTDGALEDIRRRLAGGGS